GLVGLVQVREQGAVVLRQDGQATAADLLVDQLAGTDVELAVDLDALRFERLRVRLGEQHVLGKVGGADDDRLRAVAATASASGQQDQRQQGDGDTADSADHCSPLGVGHRP